MSNTTVDPKQEFVAKITAFEPQLYQRGIDAKFDDPANPHKLQEFKVDRLHFSLCVQRAQLNIANVLLQQLEQNSQGFEEGIANLEREVKNINDTVGFLQSLSRVIGIVNKIVGLAL